MKSVFNGTESKFSHFFWFYYGCCRIESDPNGDFLIRFGLCKAKQIAINLRFAQVYRKCVRKTADFFNLNYFRIEINILK
jgi:hypothetical protein